MRIVNTTSPHNMNRSVREFVRNCLVEEDGGQVENATATAEETADALARLVNLLAEKGVLDVDDVCDIAIRVTMDGAELKKETP